MLLFALTTMHTLVANSLPILLALDNYNVSWALVLFSVILGLLVTLSASRRTSEIKRHKDD